MPRMQPSQSFQELRKLCEQWSWIDARTGVKVTGFNPPKDAIDRKRKAFYVKYLTKKGVVEQGEVVCLKVDLRRHQRMVMFTGSNEIRIINDVLIIEVNGIRIFAH